jgi:hypothetical protein
MQGFFKSAFSNASNDISDISDISNITNIFRIGKKKNYLSYLNLLYKDMFYEKTKYCNIKKIFFDNHKFDWELYIMVTLDTIGLDIYPQILDINYSKSESQIYFDTKDLTPLRKVFENNGANFHLLINELLSFIRNIRMKKVMIGNLHIDSIYINLSTMKFYILDLSNTTFTDTTDLDINLQSLYISLRETEIKDKVIKYLDKEMELFNNTLSKYTFTNNLMELYQN